MTAEHYFSSEPGTDFKPRTINVNLAGHKVSVTTSGGIFSPEHLDTGTAVLLEQIEQAPIGGDILDIGCGWGPISLALALERPLATIWAVDVNERALELTKSNAQALGLTNIRVMKPQDVPADIEFSGIWSNPPIRVGKEVLHGILKTWLPRLRIDAESYLVVQKNLGADSLLRWIQHELKSHNSEKIDSAKGFRIIRVQRES